MPRTIVDLPSSQLRDLDSRCRSEGISRAEAVRRAIHAYLRESHADSEQGFGIWKEGASRTRRTQAEGDP
jgi:metal-responsive CopG/Arc/MetJ family transcriptional regulator